MSQELERSLREEVPQAEQEQRYLAEAVKFSYLPGVFDSTEVHSIVRQVRRSQNPGSDRMSEVLMPDSSEVQARPRVTPRRSRRPVEGLSRHDCHGNIVSQGWEPLECPPKSDKSRLLSRERPALPYAAGSASEATPRQATGSSSLDWQTPDTASPSQAWQVEASSAPSSSSAPWAPSAYSAPSAPSAYSAPSVQSAQSAPSAPLASSRAASNQSEWTPMSSGRVPLPQQALLPTHMKTSRPQRTPMGSESRDSGYSGCSTGDEVSVPVRRPLQQAMPSHLAVAASIVPIPGTGKADGERIRRPPNSKWTAASKGKGAKAARYVPILSFKGSVAAETLARMVARAPGSAR